MIHGKFLKINVALSQLFMEMLQRFTHRHYRKNMLYFSAYIHRQIHNQLKTLPDSGTLL